MIGEILTLSNDEEYLYSKEVYYNNEKYALLVNTKNALNNKLLLVKTENEQVVFYPVDNTLVSTIINLFKEDVI